jgi:hypothetical protein
MAILKGRVDGLEYKVQELSAGQFSSSTKMMGQAVFTTGFVDTSSTTDNRLTSEYNFMLMMHTSFTGKDHLHVSLDQGNHDDLVMDSAMDMVMSSVTVSSLYYQFPVGDVQITAGPLLDQDDVISATTSIYSDAFRLAAMPYGLQGNKTGAGAAVSWANDNGINASFSAIAKNTTTMGNMTTNGADNASTGMFTRENANDTITASIGYDSDNYGGGLIYTDDDTDTSLGGGVYFRPDGFPTISISYDKKDITASGSPDTSEFMVGFDYEVGPGTASAAYLSADDGTNTLGKYEVYYNYPVNDGVSVQGGFFTEEQAGSTADTTGYVVETFFSF